MAIRPTFYGFEMARAALAASQRNTDVTGQNIANINTPGYSRQRVNLASIGAGNLSWRYGISPDSNVGLGVDMTGVQRMRDQFLDVRYWKESSDYSRFAVKADGLNSVEMLMDEFSTENVHGILNNFNDALQYLNNNADEIEYASQARMIATTLTRTLNKVASDISDIKKDQITQLTLVKDRINQIAEELDYINIELTAQKIQGTVSNELLDKRDLALDELSSYGNVRIVYESGVSEGIMEEVPPRGIPGSVSVYFGDIENEVCLVDGTRGERLDENDVGGYWNTLELDFDSLDVTENIFEQLDEPLRLVWYTGDPAIFTSGQIFGYYELLNGVGDTSKVDDEIDLSSKGIPFFMNMLDNFASSFAEAFNNINDDWGTLFAASNEDDIKAYNIKISDEWLDDATYILRTTSHPYDPDDPDSLNTAENDNILRMIYALKREDREIGENGFVGSFHQYVSSFNSEITIEVNYNNKQIAISDGLMLSIENMRDSVMSVSEDEEAMNLMRFQKSYTAAARLMTALDEMLDVVVNKMGLVGR